MLEHLRAYLTRPTLFLAAGIAIGALLAPAFGGGAAQGVTTYTRALSCPGLAWHPRSSNQAALNDGTLRTGAGYFMCAVDLPHKAKVTRVRFTLLDITDGSVTNCALVRQPLAINATYLLEVMASVGTTTNINIQRLTDATISFATIDNMNYAYFLQCQINPSTVYYYQGVYGADITYKITAANG